MKFTNKVKSKVSNIGSKKLSKPKEQNNIKSQDSNQGDLKKISDLEMVIVDLKEKLTRSLADSENLRKRGLEEVNKTKKYAIFKFASELVKVMEVFHVAIDNLPQDFSSERQEIKSFIDGIQMTKEELNKIFRNNGIERINPIGEKFDHNYHEAVAQVESEQEEGLVADVVQAGYKINERLIKSALVTVSKKKNIE